jgi:hypothetical protein
MSPATSAATVTTGGDSNKPKAAAPTVARAPLQAKPCSCTGGGSDCESCRKPKGDTMLQRAAAGPTRAAAAPPIVNRVLDSPGRPLDAPTRAFMEPRFGRDFGGVRVHDDPLAAASAQAIDAHAYTVGQHIAFGSGKYDPGSRSGQNLLAHELAHTVQQRGATHTPHVLPLRATPEYDHLENEAHRVAQSVLNAPGTAALPQPTLTPARPMLSRQGRESITTATSPDTPKEEQSQRKWQAVTTPVLKNTGVSEYAIPADKSGIVAVKMAGPLTLPPEKGPVEAIWQQRAAAGGLEAILVAGEDVPRTKAGLKQDRPPSEELRKIWLHKVGWLPEKADEHWKAAGGDAASYKPPQAGGKTCQVDHILELQFGGNNLPNNMQMLDGPENMQSGREIFSTLKGKAEDITKAFASDRIDIGGAENVLIHYDSVTQPKKPICKECCNVEKNAPKFSDVSAAKGESVAGKQGTPYPFHTAGQTAALIVLDEKKKVIPFDESDVPENKHASTLISGFQLLNWHRTGKGGTVDAAFDTASRFPSSLKGDVSNKPISLTRHEDGTLKLPPGHRNVKFHFDYLSEGVFDKLNLDDDGVLSGSGTITPSFSFLPKFEVRFDKDKLELAKAIPQDKLKLPIPGVKIKKAEIALELAPEFKPEGRVDFALDAGARHILDGSITVSADAQGLVMEGDVQVSLPGVDNAGGHIKYQNRQWSGKAEISADRLQSKLKYVKSGSVVVLFGDHGMTADGKVSLDLPFSKGMDAEVIYESSNRRWLFKGKGVFQPRGLKEVEMSVEYDGEHIFALGRTGFEFHGIGGTLDVQYRDGRFSGEGKLTIKKGKADGSLHVKMREVNGEPKFSGDGSISYQLTENLVTTVGIEIDEKQDVRLKGALTFPKPIKLFDPIQGDYKFFEVGINIPIPGASIGPAGLQARIDGSLSAGYKLGPGELRNTSIEAAFNPLDEKPDADIILKSTLYIGASAYISGRIAGSIVLDAVVASVSGGLAITATASLDGHVAAEVMLHYQKSRFEADAKFEMLVGLALTLALDAFIKAKAGVGWFSIEREKDWNLATFRYDTGLQFGMKLKNPLHYASDEPIKLPSFDDIEWIKPQVDPVDMIKKIFAGAGGTEKDAE